jgi:hypothetical protein
MMMMYSGFKKIFNTEVPLIEAAAGRPSGRRQESYRGYGGISPHHSKMRFSTELFFSPPQSSGSRHPKKTAAGHPRSIFLCFSKKSARFPERCLKNPGGTSDISINQNNPRPY